MLLLPRRSKRKQSLVDHWKRRRRRALSEHLEPRMLLAVGENLLTNGGFETAEATSGGLPGSVADWRGDVSTIVRADRGIAPHSGDQMLRFDATGWSGGASAGTSSELMQLIDVSDLDSGATLRASMQVNRVAGDAQTDDGFSVEIRAFAGSPASFSSDFTNNELAISTGGYLLSDADPSTWELVHTNPLPLPEGTDYVSVRIVAAENIFNDSSGVELDGHYADAVVLEQVGVTAVFKNGFTNPLLIEPYDGTEDTMIMSNQGGEKNQNFGARSDFAIGEAPVDGKPGGGFPRRSLLRFDVSAFGEPLPTIQSASLRLYPSVVDATTEDTVEVFRLADANAAWIEGTEVGVPSSNLPPDNGMTTWDNRIQGVEGWAGGSGIGVAGTDYTDLLGSQTFNTLTGIGADNPFDIQLDPSLVQGLIEDWAGGINAGLFLRSTAERDNIITFRSSDFADAALRPELIIQYDPVVEPTVIRLNEVIGVPGTDADTVDGSGNAVNFVATALNTGPTALGVAVGSVAAPFFNFNTYGGVDRTSGFVRGDLLRVVADRKHDSSPLILDLNNNGFSDDVAQTGFGAHSNRFITFDLAKIRADHGLPATQAFDLSGVVGPANATPATMSLMVLLDGNPIVIHDTSGSGSLAFSEAISGIGRFLTFAALDGSDGNPFFAHGGFVNVELQTVDVADPLVSVDLQAASDSGVLDTDNLTNDNTPTFDIRVNQPGSLEVDYDGDGSPDETQVITAAGTYEFTAPALDDGAYTTSATFTAATFDPVSDAESVTIDTVGPRVLLTESTAGNALRFDGVDDVVIVPHDNSLDVTTNFTFEAWVKREDTGVSHTILSRDFPGDDTDGSYQWFLTDEGGMRVEANNQGSVNSGAVGINVGQWHHVATSYDAAASPNTRIYVDGAEVGSGDISLPLAFNSDLLIGRRGTDTLFYQGELDELRIWNTTRTPEAIAANYLRAVSGTESGLVLYLQFDEDQGSEVRDASAAGNHGQLGGGIASREPVRVASTADIQATAGNALAFDGEDDFVAIGGTASLNSLTSEATFEAWIAPEPFVGVNGGYLFSRRDPFSTESFSVAVSNGGGLVLVLKTNTGSPKVYGSAANAIAFSEYQHLAVTFNSNTGVVAAYVDGTPIEINATDGNNVVTGTLVSTTNLDIGRRQGLATSEGVDGAAHYRGLIDEIRVWNIARSQTEIAKGLAGKLRGDEAGLVLYLQFDEDEGSEVRDASAADNHGLLGGGIASSEPERVASTVNVQTPTGNALSLNGIDQFVEIDSPLSPMVSDGEMTISGWVYVRKFATDTYPQARQPIISKGGTGGYEYALYVYDSGDVGLSLWNSGGGPIAEPFSTGVKIDLNRWHHVAGTANADGTARVYLDGELVAESPPLTAAFRSGFYPVQIGARGDGQYLDALIEDVQIWNVERTPEQIRQDFNGQTTGSEAGLIGYWRFSQSSGETVFDSSSGGNNGLLRNGAAIVSSTRVTNSASIEPPLQSLGIVFNEFIDASTFDVDDVSIVGPNGDIQPTGINGADNLFTVAIPTQNAPGNYRFDIGPDIRDLAGNLMDQDEDGTGGEDPEDVAALVVDLQASTDLIVEIVTAETTALSGSQLDVSWRVRNQGVTPTIASAWSDRLYLSTDDVFDLDDAVLGTFVRNVPLGVEEDYSRSVQVTVPDGIEGTFYLFVVTDALEEVFEGARDDNNVTAALSTIEVTRSPEPDLQVTAVTGPANGRPNQTVQIDWTVTNVADGDADAVATGPWTDRVYLSADGQTDGAVLLATVTRSDDLAIGEGYNQSIVVVLPDVADGSYQILIQTDADDQVFEGGDEGNDANNITAATPPLVIGHPDLQPSELNAPASVTSGDSVSVDWLVTNGGTFALFAADRWTDRLYLSTNETFDPAVDRLLGELAMTGPLAIDGDGAGQLIDVTIPVDVSGSWFVLLLIDADDEVNELGAESNNVLARPIEIELAPYADLAVSNVVAPQQLIGDPVTAEISWTVTNVGTGRGQTDIWVDRVVASPNTTFGDSDDVVLGQIVHTGGLDQDASYDRTEIFVLPPRLQNRFHVFVRSDAHGAVFENNSEGNNTAEAANLMDVLRIPPADLVIPSVTAAATGASGTTLPVSWRVENSGIGTTSTAVWNDVIRLATDPAGQSIVRTLGSFAHTGVLAPGGGYDRTADVFIPHGVGGPFYVVVTTGGPFEFLSTDNNTAVSELVEITLSDPPDLEVTEIIGPTNQVFAGSRIDVQWSVRNVGTNDATGSTWVDRVSIREAGNAAAPLITLGNFTYTLPLEAGKSYSRVEQVTLPSGLQGAFEIVVETNVTGSLYEAGLSDNNRLVNDAVITVALPPRPDLQILTANAPPTVSALGAASLDFTVINQSTVGTTTPNWTDRVYLSLDNQISSDDALLTSPSNQSALEPQGQYLTQTESFIIPRRFAGEVFFLIQIDAGGGVTEVNENNNVLAVPVEVIPLPPSDLVASDVVAPAQAFDGNTIEVRYTVTNRGSGPTDREAWNDTIWLARDARRPSPLRTRPDGTTFGKGDIKLATLTHSGPLDVGESYEVTTTVRLPERQTGELFITVWSDAFDVVTEVTNADYINPDDPNELENNNYKARPITVVLTPPPDLEVTSVSPQVSGVGGEPYTVSWTVANEGNSAATESSWNDRVYLSNSPILGEGSRQWILGDVKHQGGLGVGETYSASATFDLTPPAAGLFVIVETNFGRSAFEGPLTDNNTASAATSVTRSAPADLQVTSISAPPENFSGELATIEWTVQNNGETTWAGTRYWTDIVYLTPDPVFNSSRVLTSVNRTVSLEQPLAGGESYTDSADLTLPPGIEGTFYVHVLVNSGGSDGPVGFPFNANSRLRFETNLYEATANNRFSESISVVYREPDLTVTGITVPATPPGSGEVISIGWTVENPGTRATRRPVYYDRVYLSRDPSLDEDDQLLGEVRRGAIIPAGGSYAQSVDVRLPEGIEGDFHILVFTDSNFIGPPPPSEGRVTPEDPLTASDRPVDFVMARILEFQDEGNNVASAPLNVVLIEAADLQVTQLLAPTTVLAGQTFDIDYTVTNVSDGATSPLSPTWDDLFYLSRDEFLDLRSDRYLGFQSHIGQLDGRASYSSTVSLTLPPSLTGSYYVFAVSDPIRNSSMPRGDVFEGAAETNNATPSSVPMIINLPPPSDLQVDNIALPPSAQSGDEITIEWTVSNHGDNVAQGKWADTAYLSADAIWDIGDVPLGRVEFEGSLAVGDGTNPGESYTSSLSTRLPPARPGSYRVIVRSDIFNQVFEEAGEANNQTASSDSLQVTVDQLQLNVPLQTTLSTGQERLYQVTVPIGQTLRIKLTSQSGGAANELFARFDDVPNGIVFDVASSGPLMANQTLLIPDTQPGEYFVLVRGHSQPRNDTPIRLLAELLPFQITSVSPDLGGDSRYVTTIIRGAQIHPDAIVKLVRPGIAELEPDSYEVVDSTKIVAVFDFTDQPRGLYDLKVINPDAEAIIPYRYLIERAIEPEATIGLGGPRVLAPGETGTYGVTLQSRTNIDTPYTYFSFGVPELGLNEDVYNFRYVSFTNNLRGGPEDGSLEDVPFASLVSTVNTDGQNLAPGYVFDLPATGFVSRTFNAEIYPGLQELIDAEFAKLVAKIEATSPEFRGRLKAPEDLDLIQPGLFEIYQSRAHPLALIEDESIAFQFYITASATSLTREEFVVQQSAEALRLRDAVLADENAAQALVVLAADAGEWTQLYLAALEESGWLRPDGEAPPPRERAPVVSLMSTLASGILAGPAGDEIVTEGDIVSFFEDIRRWYGHDPSLETLPSVPSFEQFDLGTSRTTHFEAFNIYVPYGEVRLDEPGLVTVPPPDFDSLFDADGGSTELVSLVGPLGAGAEQFVPIGASLPYTVRFQNAADAPLPVGEVQIVTQLDPNLDARRFRLGDLRVGDIEVHIPVDRATFQGDFDFADAKGFLLRVNAGIDPVSSTAVWRLSAIDPDTGEVLEDATRGLLPPNNAQGDGSGFVTYTVTTNRDVVTGTELKATARVLFNTAAPQDTNTLTQLVDAVAPTSTINSQRLSGSETDYEVNWSAADDIAGSGVKHVTVYVAEDGGDFRIWQRQSSESSAIYSGEVGKRYEFLALATDNAGNREQPTFGLSVPDDGSGANLGALPAVDQTTTFEFDAPPIPDEPSTNPLFVEASQNIPAAAPTTRRSQFENVLRPFTAQSFATGFAESHADIGPLAIVELLDGSILASGGTTRGSLYRFDDQGGSSTESGALIGTLPYPMFDLAINVAGQIWATTGGGPLLQLSADGSEIVNVYADGITQSLAIDPATQKIFVSSGHGIEIFDPATETFSHYSDLRVGNLRFAPDGRLWATTWPDRGNVVRFDENDDPQLQLQFESSAGVDSLAFGHGDSQLDDLLLISRNDGVLTMVDLATLNQIDVATGGTRGDVVQTTSDGRILVSQSDQIDVLNPISAPTVIGVNPASESEVILPFGAISVIFDQLMFVGSSSDSNSVVNPANYQLTDQQGDPVEILEVLYDAQFDSAILIVPLLQAGDHELRVSDSVANNAGATLIEPFVTSFRAISNFNANVDIEFLRTRSSRLDGTVSYDVLVTNTGDVDLLVPLTLVLDASDRYTGAPLDAQPQDGGRYLIDLSANLPSQGRLRPGESTVGRTITATNPNQQRVDLLATIAALPTANLAPQLQWQPSRRAVVGKLYSEQVVASDPDGSAISYLLVTSPEGMTVDASGQLLWTPNASTPATVDVVLQVFDVHGATARHRYQINVSGGNRAPRFERVTSLYTIDEGRRLLIDVSAVDPDGDSLVYGVENLPPGSTFDPQRRVLDWTPSFDSAGTYDIAWIASDGLAQTVQPIQILVRPSLAPLDLVVPDDVAVRQGEPVVFRVWAFGADDTVKFSSSLLPPGATLDPQSGEFRWTPDYFVDGRFEIPFAADSSQAHGSAVATVQVLNRNAPPEFVPLGPAVVQEGQTLRIRAFAFDPDNPDFIPPDRFDDGRLSLLDGSSASVTVTAENLPDGAAFDQETWEFVWEPSYQQAGNYQVTFSATDDGDGLGTPLTTNRNLNISVLNTNGSPVIETVDNVVLGRTEVQVLDVRAADPEGDPIVLSATDERPGFALPDFITFTDNGDGSGQFRFAPEVGDRGDYAIILTATDDGGVNSGQGSELETASDQQTFIVTVNSPNEPPMLAYLGDKVAVVDQAFSLNLSVGDLDEDELTFSAVGLPGDAVLTPGSVYGTATLDWTPTAADIGTHTVTVRVTDSGNGNPAEMLVDEQTIDLVVRTTNSAPLLAAIGDRTVGETQTLLIELSAVDTDGDPTSFGAVNLPPGASFNRETGTFLWTPNLFQSGSYENITFSTSDGSGLSSETIAITVENLNQPPIVVPTPLQSVREGNPLSFEIAAGDPDGESLALSIVSGQPSGSSFDPQTGQFTWTPSFDQSGLYTMRVTAEDPSGAQDQRDVMIHVANVNREPTLGVSSHAVALGSTLQFSLVGNDADIGTTLTYGATGLPVGALLDTATGQVTWTPGPGQAGDYPILFSVSDGEETTKQAALIQASLQPAGPALAVELTPSFPVTPGQSIGISLVAGSLADIVDLQLTIDGQGIELDGNRAVFTPATPGRFEVTAVATDADGLVRERTTTIKVRDPDDQLPPTVVLSRALNGSALAETTDVLATISDQNLDQWTLQLKSNRTGELTVLAQGVTPVDSETLVQLDPSSFNNGFYTLTLSASDIGGREAEDTLQIEIGGETTSIGSASATDLSVELGGISFDLVRQYDPALRHQSLEFGHGWRLSVGDLDIETNVPATTPARAVVDSALRMNSRMYLTLTDGQRLGFTFVPILRKQAGVQYYTPTWSPDANVNYVLDTPQVVLKRAGQRFYQQETGLAYNPFVRPGDNAQPAFELTSPDGSTLGVDAQGRVRSLTTAAGERLTVTDSGIAAFNGDAVQFVYDQTGRIAEAFAPDGTKVVYLYDSDGNLIAVRNLTTAQHVAYGYDPADRHRLQVIAPASGVGTVFQSDPPASLPLEGSFGGAINFIGAPKTGEASAGETDRYAIVLRDSEVDSTPTRSVLVGVAVELNAGDLQLDPPRLMGSQALQSFTDANGSFALFRLEDAGLHVVEITASSGSGSYSVELIVIGDVDQDGNVDGIDADLLDAARGSSAGDTAYLITADTNRDGTVDSVDALNLAANFGFTANRPPQLIPNTTRAHVDQEVLVSLDGFGLDPERDRVFYRIAAAEDGSAEITGSGLVRFTPESGFSGQASFTVVADDGFASSEPIAMTVNVSDAPLVNIDLSPRQPDLEIGTTIPLELTGDFADEADVPLQMSYVQLESLNPNIVRIDGRGQLVAIGRGAGILSVSHGDISAVTVVNVGEGFTRQHELIDARGLRSLPSRLQLDPAASQQLTIVAGDLDLSGSVQGTRYFSSNEAVALVDAQGVVTAVSPGNATITAISGPAETLIDVQVSATVASPANVDERGGLVRSDSGIVLSVPEGAVGGATSISITALDQAELPLPVIEPFEFVSAFRLDLDGVTTDDDLHLAVPTPGLDTGSPIVIYRAGVAPQPDGSTREVWFQEQTALVGDDGFARTGSDRIAPGIFESGDYLVAYAPPDLVGRVDVTFNLANPLAATTTAFDLSFQIAPQPAVGAGSALRSLSAGEGEAGSPVGEVVQRYVPLTSDFLVTIGMEFSVYTPNRQYTMNEIGVTGTFQAAAGSVLVNPGQVSVFQQELVNDSLPPGSPSDPPVPESIAVEFVFIDGNIRPVVKLVGERFEFDGQHGDVEFVAAELDSPILQTGDQVQFSVEGGKDVLAR